MSMPGYAAEVSLYRTAQQYRMAAGSGTGRNPSPEHLAPQDFIVSPPLGGV